jgi:hypothetical protein
MGIRKVKRIRQYFSVLFILLAQIVSAAEITGQIRDSIANSPISDVIISVAGSPGIYISDVRGQFRVTGLSRGTFNLHFSRIGYTSRTVSVAITENEIIPLSIQLVSSAVQLKEISVTSTKNTGQALSTITQTDFSLRPTNSAQDLLRLVPGLFTAQHAGGGKAEQIFLRGFDVDHGTDFAVSIDGIPVNMVSHAHGQGYADFHFVIPETVDRLYVHKGPYSARHGNFATSGAGDFFTKNSLTENSVKIEAGRFDTYRAVALLRIPPSKLFKLRNENAYVAGEYHFTNAYFNAPQKLNRFNAFFKYSAEAGNKVFVSLSASAFQSNWFGSGQIPHRAVTDSIIDRFGAIDNTEGGSTSRYNFNSTLIFSTGKNGTIKNQFYFSHYKFDLYSNFTFFLNDTVNGDQIRQTEKGRDVYGNNISYETTVTSGKIAFNTVIGAGSRFDNGVISLMRSIRRVTFDTTTLGKIDEKNFNAYAEETVNMGSKVSIKASLRYDYFLFSYNNFLGNDGKQTAGKSRVSPKLSIHYTPSASLIFYAKSGLGFHSNDSRAVISGEAGNSLPRALGYETGATFLVSKSALFNIALWGLDLESELVYVGDEGVIEISGATRRLGIDFSMRNQIKSWLYFDFDINYNYGRYINLPEGSNFIPLAPSLTSAGGISCINKKGLTTSLRYRFIDSRPANENNSVQAKGYFLLDAVATYSWKKFKLGISAENLLNREWNEAQFDTLSRLNTESAPVSELHYTPGTPFFIKSSLAVSF